VAIPKDVIERWAERTYGYSSVKEITAFGAKRTATRPEAPGDTAVVIRVGNSSQRGPGRGNCHAIAESCCRRPRGKLSLGYTLKVNFVCVRDNTVGASS